jgi:hypothetical protein
VSGEFNSSGGAGVIYQRILSVLLVIVWCVGNAWGMGALLEF